MFGRETTNGRGYFDNKPYRYLSLLFVFQFICCRWPDQKFLLLFVSHRNKRKRLHTTPTDIQWKLRFRSRASNSSSLFLQLPSNERRHVSTTTDAILSFFVIWSSSRLPLLSIFVDRSSRIGDRFWWAYNFSRPHFQSCQRRKRQREHRGSREL